MEEESVRRGHDIVRQWNRVNKLDNTGDGWGIVALVLLCFLVIAAFVSRYSTGHPEEYEKWRLVLVLLVIATVGVTLIACCFKAASRRLRNRLDKQEREERQRLKLRAIEEAEVIADLEKRLKLE